MSKLNHLYHAEKILFVDKRIRNGKEGLSQYTGVLRLLQYITGPAVLRVENRWKIIIVILLLIYEH